MSNTLVTTIYILKLGNDKKYVGRLDNGYDLDERMKVYTSGKGSKWVMRHGFIECEEVFQGDEFSEMTTTLRLMKKYGIDNVRGACWNAESPYRDNYVAAQIKRMIESVYNSCHICGQDGHYSYFCSEIRS